MQIEVEKVEGLTYKIKVKITTDVIEGKAQERLKEIAPKAQVPGFRKGHVPQTILNQRFGEQVRAEAIDNIVQGGLDEDLRQRDIVFATKPEVEHGHITPGQDYTMTLTCEIFPQFELNDISGVTVETITCDITDKDLDAAIERIRDENPIYNDVERAVKVGDKVVFDFAGSIDGEALENGSAENHELVIGDKSFIEDLEQGLIGMKAGDEKTIDAKFPDDYHHDVIAGKTAQFAVKMHHVKEKQAAELNDAFAKSLDMESLEALREDVKARLEADKDARIKQLTRERLIDALYVHYHFDLPSKFVEEQAQRMNMERMMTMMRSGQKLPEDMSAQSEETQKMAERSARRDILLLKYGKKYDVKEAAPQRVLELVEQAAEDYKDPDEMIRHIYGNKEMLERFQNMAIEQQVLDAILAEMKTVKKALTLDTLKELEK